MTLGRGMAHARTACRLAQGQTGHAQFRDDLERRVEERLPEPTVMIGPLAAPSRPDRHRGRISAPVLTPSTLNVYTDNIWAEPRRSCSRTRLLTVSRRVSRSWRRIYDGARSKRTVVAARRTR